MIYDPSSTPPHRFRFGLRTLFVVVTVVACWCGYSMNWIRQRREVLDNTWPELNHSQRFLPIEFGVRAPGGLWLFGEKGIKTLSFGLRPSEAHWEARVRRLFPEAKLWVLHVEEPVDKKIIRTDLSNDMVREAVEAINRLVKEDEDKRAQTGQQPNIDD